MARYLIEREFQVSPMITSQCAGAGIDLYANWVSIVIGKQFKLSVRGQRNINTALNNLPVYIASDDTLSFGWTLQHAIRNQSVHKGLGGYEHLALEGVLSESFPERYAAKVLYEMAKAFAGESDMIPHFGQWRSLIHSSSGAFRSSDFGLLVEEYIRLYPYSHTLQDALEDARHVPSPKSVSLALEAVAQVSSGRGKQVLIVGGPVLGWFAAVAEWLFDLRIAIYSSAGERLHVDHEYQDTQLVLVYDQKPGIICQLEPKGDLGQAKEAAIKSQLDAESTQSIAFGGRVVWNSLLPRIFGRSFHHLDREETRTLGTAIGAAARAFQELAENKEFEDVVSAQNKSNAASFGAGLVQTLTNWLPELRHLQGRMERQLKLPFEEARKTYFEQIRHLQRVCGCSICSSQDASLAALKISSPHDGHCLTALVETIIALGLTISRITVAPQIYPTRHGIHSLYSSQAAKRMEARELDVSDIRHFSIIYGNEWNASGSRRLQNCAEIFSGSRPMKNIPENLVALSQEGMCVYMVKLEKSESSALSDYHEGLIRVVSGGICVRQKVFSRACLGAPSDTVNFEDFWEEVPCAHLPQPLYCRW